MSRSAKAARIAVWPAIQAFFRRQATRMRGGRPGGVSRSIPRNAGSAATPGRVPIVALLAGEDDRGVLAHVSAGEPWDVHFTASFEAARDAAHRFGAPVVVLDRDWPGAEWRTVVHELARASQRTCVILVSGVADEYLCQELIRSGGYDVLAKPLHAAALARVVKLALSYWEASTPVVQEAHVGR